MAALGPVMLGIAARQASGTITWMVGLQTLADHIVPTITAAAAAAGRPRPQVVVTLPVCVTADPAAARERAGRIFSVYGQLPSYRAMLDREGAAGPPDVAIVGDRGGGRRRPSPAWPTPGPPNSRPPSTAPPTRWSAARPSSGTLLGAGRPRAVTGPAQRG